MEVPFPLAILLFTLIYQGSLPAARAPRVFYNPHLQSPAFNTSLPTGWKACGCKDWLEHTKIHMSGHWNSRKVFGPFFSFFSHYWVKLSKQVPCTDLFPGLHGNAVTKIRWASSSQCFWGHFRNNMGIGIYSSVTIAEKMQCLIFSWKKIRNPGEQSSCIWHKATATSFSPGNDCKLVRTWWASTKGGTRGSQVSL